jgi:hypothetical protein
LQLFNLFFHDDMLPLYVVFNIDESAGTARNLPSLPIDFSFKLSAFSTAE